MDASRSGVCGRFLFSHVNLGFSDFVRKSVGSVRRCGEEENSGLEEERRVHGDV